MPKEQRKFVFSGGVQGVGFRYTAIRIAAGYEVTGYVRNLPGGQVECVVEGESEEISAFVGDLGSAMGGYIRERTVQVAPYSGQFQTFTVRY